MDSLKKHRGKIIISLSFALIAVGYFYFWTYQPDFSKEEILSIELIKVYNGVENSMPLAPENIRPLFQDLRWTRSSGRVKMFTCFRIILTTSSGRVLRFRTNGKKFYDPYSDTLYNFGGNENLITKYWNIQPVCPQGKENS